MKKKSLNRMLIYFASFIIIGMSLSCKDTLEEKFVKPNALTDASFETLFTGTLQTLGFYIPDYGSEYHNLRNMNRLLGLGYFPGAYPGGLNTYPDGTYTMYTGWSGGTLRNTIYRLTFVNIAKNFPVMNLKLNSMTPEDRANYEIYVLCINIAKANAFQKCTDVYDDVPFSEAGGAYDGKFWPKYDSQKDIYYSLLDSLKVISDKLKVYSLNSSIAHTNFKQFDILNDGDVSKWEKYANSLRLRMAIRLSIVDPDKSKEVIGDIISSNAPLVTSNDDNIGIATKDFGRIYEVHWYRSFYEVFYNQSVPNFLIQDVFGYNGPATPTNEIDPRLYVIAQPTIFGEYHGILPWSSEQTDQINAVYPNDPENSIAISWDYDENFEPYWSMYNKVTYNNFNRKHPAFTSSETHLLLAEAALRFPEVTSGIDAVDEYNTSISQSIDYYYEINNGNTFDESSTPAIPNDIIENSKYPKPDQAVIDAFLTNKRSMFSALSTFDKIKEIFYQKFTHLNILNHYEIWAETRRLEKEYGILTPTSPKILWIERFMYPEDEPSVNPNQFETVAHKNDYETPVWWTGR